MWTWFIYHTDTAEHIVEFVLDDTEGKQNDA